MPASPPTSADVDYQTIRYALDQDLAEITLARPGKLNAMNQTMRRELTHAFHRASAEARALVITGAEPTAADVRRAFCAGQDLGDIRSEDLERVLIEEYAPMLQALHDAPIPTVAIVHGAAAGAGMHRALTADIVVAARSASFVAPFARIGLIPAGAGSYWLPRLIGPARAKAMALLGEPVDAETALGWGMIWAIEEEDQALDRGRALARRLASGPTAAFALAKQALGASLDHDFAEHLACEAALQGRAGRTRDYREGVAAFLEKRRPRFEGR